MKERGYKATLESLRTALLTELEAIVRGSGDVRLNIEEFFGRLIRSIGNNGTERTMERYDISKEYIEKLEAYLGKGGVA
jgi:hypothetical protein